MFWTQGLLVAAAYHVDDNITYILHSPCFGPLQTYSSPPSWHIVLDSTPCGPVVHSDLVQGKLLSP